MNFDPKEYTVLLVDDEPDILDIEENIFYSEGFNTFTATSAKSALDVLTENKIDVVISDVQMRKSDGVFLLKLIKEKNAKKPIVFLHTAGSIFELEDLYDMGAEAVIPKPCNLDALPLLVEQSLRPRLELWTRKHLRVEANFKPSSFLIDKKPISNVVCKDLSPGGMCIGADNLSLPIGSSFIFEISYLKGRWAPFDVKAKVNWVKGVSDNNDTAYIGLEFIELSKNSKRKLIRLVNDLRLEILSTGPLSSEFDNSLGSL